MQSRRPPVEKNQTIDVVFEDMTHDGAGVAKVDGYPIFVPGAIPEEAATVKVLKVTKGYGYGKLLEFTKRSPYRAEPPCPIFAQCGGCQLQHLEYEAQLEYKKKLVDDALRRIGHLDGFSLYPVIGMNEPWKYRNKAQVPIGEEEGGLIAGFFQKRTHRIINMEECLIQSQENDTVIQSVKKILDKYWIRAYDEERHQGTIRHIMTRYSHFDKEVMLVLITLREQLPHKKKIIDEIVQTLPQVSSIVQNINPKRTNVIFGEKTQVLWGKEYLHDRIGNIQFAISARSFYQVNPIQTKALYEKALEFAELSGNEIVIDAYCGIGTISLFLAQKAKKVYGVEIVPEAVQDAKRNAELNGLENVLFEAGEAETIIPQWYQKGIQADVIVVDPPRKGCEASLLQTIIEMKPQKVVYVSCNPATLARDLNILENGGYKTTKVQPVDMFPHTTHVESVAQLILK